jgi:hypothetical protein
MVYGLQLWQDEYQAHLLVSRKIQGEAEKLRFLSGLRYTYYVIGTSRLSFFLFLRSMGTLLTRLNCSFCPLKKVWMFFNEECLIRQEKKD